MQTPFEPFNLKIDTLFPYEAPEDAELVLNQYPVDNRHSRACGNPVLFYYLFRLYDEYLLFAYPKRRYEEKGHPNALTPNEDLGFPELLTIANASFKFASLLS